MHVARCCCTLVIAMAFAGSALAQATNAGDDTTGACNVEKAALETRMELARSKGQMLLRRQLADQLAALQTSCKPLSADQSRAVSIEKLEKEVRALRTELETAEEQLRKLKNDASR